MIIKCMSTINRVKKKIIFFVSTVVCIVAGLLQSPSLLDAQPAMPGFYGKTSNASSPEATALPILKTSGDGVAYIENKSGNRMVVHQDEKKAVVNWHSFDIGEDASVYFDQQGNPDWAALNRIWDLNPSRIFGQLSADGRIFLLNQNGILFSPDAQINVQALTASALDLKDTDFLTNQLSYRYDNYMEQENTDVSDIYVSNHGRIETKEGGAVFLIGPHVENNGTIQSPAGQIGLIAGTEATLITPQTIDAEDKRVAKRVQTATSSEINGGSDAGTVINYEKGVLETRSGTIGMYGKVVNQKGYLRAVTAVKREGNIELVAVDEILTGKDSVTECPVSNSEETVHASFGGGLGSVTMTVQGGASSADGEATGRIIHQGRISAPRGRVEMTAPNRIYIDYHEEDSQTPAIDVGGLWVEEDMGVNQAHSQLNSMELRDEFGQKDNEALKGETVSFSTTQGSALGDMSGALGNRELTIRENSTEGGEIKLLAREGDVIIRDGSVLDVSGGGYIFGEGGLSTTKLVSGNRVYDIGEAPQWVQYDNILGYYGGDFKGMCYGGAMAMTNFVPGYIQGDDGGQVEIIARNVILDGVIDGLATGGPYQDLLDDPVDDLGLKTANGRTMPRSGKLIIADVNMNGQAIDGRDYGADDIVVQQQVDKLPDTFGPDDQPEFYPDITEENPDPLFTTTLSSEALNDMHLSSIHLWSNSRLMIAEDAFLTLEAGGAFSGIGRRIEHFGTVTIPSGFVALKGSGNYRSQEVIGSEANPDYTPMTERVFLASDSVIDVSGEKVDNSFLDLTTGEKRPVARIDGGEAKIEDMNGDGVIVMSGSRIDVSGGYCIKEDETVSGGDGGILNLVGLSLVLDGTLRGFGVNGQAGGGINIHTDTIDIVPWRSSLPDAFDAGEAIPPGMERHLYLAQDQFDGTGLGSINLKTANDLTVKEGMWLQPSYMKKDVPNPGEGRVVDSGASSYTVHTQGSAMETYGVASPETVGKTQLTLKAGAELNLDALSIKNDEARLTIEEEGGMNAAPGGAIAVSGPAVDIRGSLKALSGDIKLSTSRNYDLHLGEKAQIDVSGFNQYSDDALFDGFIADVSPWDAGTISLTAFEDMVVESGAVLNVSGTKPVAGYRLDDDASYTRINLAGKPGEIQLAYGHYLNPVYDDAGSVTGQEGLDTIEIIADKYLDRLPGAEMKIAATDTETGLVVRHQDIKRLANAGVDSLTLSSRSHIAFQENMDVELGRYMELDAPELRTDTGDAVALKAPWIKITNTYKDADAIPPYTETGANESKSSSLSLTADDMDIEGAVAVSGFGAVHLSADQNLQLNWRPYLDSASNTMLGELDTFAGDLSISAACVYPVTAAEFVFKSGGDVYIGQSKTDAPGQIASAGGSLRVEGKNIIHEGTLVAPLGQIVLSAPGGDVHLKDGSSLLTSLGGDVDLAVNYGVMEDDNWILVENPDRPKEFDEVTAAPEKSVTVDASSVSMAQGAVVDVSGGGKVFAYEFLPGTDGTKNPLEPSGRYVILSDNSVHLPGDAIYLEGGNGLEEGVYSILPQAFALLPNALIVTDLDVDASMGGYMVSQDGSMVVRGYHTETNTNIRTPNLRGFAVQNASELKEDTTTDYLIMGRGNVETRDLLAGNGGIVSISADTTLIEGEIKGQGMTDEDEGGTLALAGRDIIIGDQIQNITDTQGKLILDTGRFSGDTLKAMEIGDPEVTDGIIVKAGSALSTGSITLAAGNQITVEDDAFLHGTKGPVSLIAQEGMVQTGSGTEIHAAEEITIDCRTIDLNGTLISDTHTLSFSTDHMVLSEDGASGDYPNAMVMGKPFWDTFSTLDTLYLTGRSDILFGGDVEISAKQAVFIDTPQINGVTHREFTAAVSAPMVSLVNTGDNATFSDDDPVGTTHLSLSATGTLNLGHGWVDMDKFSDVTLTGQQITFTGQGGIHTDGDLTFVASMLTTAGGQDAFTGYQVADFDVRVSDDHGLRIQGGSAKEDDLAPGIGGNVSFSAGSITQNGLVQASSANVSFSAISDIILEGGAGIVADGTYFSPAGTIALSSDQGQIQLEPDSLLSVNAGEQGDAGCIALNAPSGGVVTSGNLTALPDGKKEGVGGSLTIDSRDTANVAAWTALTSAGHGFDHDLDIRLRSGNVAIPSGDTVRAEHITLTADTGRISVSGTLDASRGTKGGTIALYAGNDLTLTSSSRLDAKKSGPGNGDGGQVLLSTAAGRLTLETGSVIDVGASWEGEKGEILFRAPAIGQGADMDLGGAVAGASQITAYAVKKYNAFDTAFIASDTRARGQNLQVGEEKLIKNNCDVDAFSARPAVEAHLKDDFTLEEDVDLSDLFGTEGELTLRCAGNLSVQADISANTSVDAPSWDINLIAGADLESADYRAVDSFVDLNEEGILTIEGGKAVYTTGGDIRFASGADTIFGSPDSHESRFASNSPFTMGSYSGNLTGFIGGDLILDGGVLQTATGDISIDSRGSIAMDKASGTKFLGTIRTLGETPSGSADAKAYWDYENGGDIWITARGDIGASQYMLTNPNAWDMVTEIPRTDIAYWSADYNGDTTTQGIAALAGGDVRVNTAGDFRAQCGNFGDGDVNIHAGKDIDGRFMIRSGASSALTAMGSLGTNTQNDMAIEMFDTDLFIGTMGDMKIGSIHNTSFVRKGISTMKSWQLDYGENAGATLVSHVGDVLLTGEDDWIDAVYDINLLPPSLEIHAGRDIRFSDAFFITPSTSGQFILDARNDIDGAAGGTDRAVICMIDAAPENITGAHTVEEFHVSAVSAVFTQNTAKRYHDADSAYRENNDGAKVHADGDIRDIKLFVQKAGEITAGENIRDLYYFGQNVLYTDRTVIQAGNDLELLIPAGTNTEEHKERGIEIGGPGELLVMAGNSIDLGQSKGIQAVANLYNINLDTAGASAIVAAGFTQPGLGVYDTTALFENLQEYGEDYSRTLASEGKIAGDQVVEHARSTIIDPFFQETITGEGVINMVDSQINTSGEYSDLFIMAVGETGDINVGRTTLPDAGAESKNSGLYTASGGNIHIFAQNDINVLESRIMTFRGGDIFLWSDKGDINAGRGSKTAVNVEPPKTSIDPNTGDVTITFEPPSVGSGIRTLTYDPDGVEGPMVEPEPGDVYLIAPAGIVDAGEAGIAGKNVFIGASEVRNAVNIEIGEGMGVGVPTPGDGLGSLASLTGEGGLGSTRDMMDQAAQLSDTKDRVPGEGDALGETIKPKWLKVDFAGYADEAKDKDENDGEEKDKEE